MAKTNMHIQTFKFHFGVKYQQESSLLPVIFRRITERFIITIWTVLAVFSDLADS